VDKNLCLYEMTGIIKKGKLLANLYIFMKATNMVAYWLVIIGALNWGLMGVGDFLGANWNVRSIWWLSGM